MLTYNVSIFLDKIEINYLSLSNKNKMKMKNKIKLSIAAIIGFVISDAISSINNHPMLSMITTVILSAQLILMIYDEKDEEINKPVN